jgi:hypothetical protein
LRSKTTLDFGTQRIGRRLDGKGTADARLFIRLFKFAHFLISRPTVTEESIQTLLACNEAQGRVCRFTLIRPVSM